MLYGAPEVPRQEREPVGRVIQSFYNDVFINVILVSFSERKFMLDIITDENLV
jgi:hypothetical protein